MCGIAAGAPEGAIYQGGNLCYTGNIAQRFEATGLVSLHSTRGFVKPTAKWQVGDILVSGSHAVVVVSGNDPSGSGAASAAVSGDVDALARVNELLGGGTSASAVSTGTGAAIAAGAYRVTASKLNVRSGPSLSGEVVASYSRGDRINSIAADVTVADGYAWAHYTAYSGKARYVAVGTADGCERYLAKI